MKSLFLIFLALAACSTPAILTPPKGPGTAYPYGYRGHACPVGGGYCGEDYACKGATSCEYVGP